MHALRGCIPSALLHPLLPSQEYEEEVLKAAELAAEQAREEGRKLGAAEAVAGDKRSASPTDASDAPVAKRGRR